MNETKAKSFLLLKLAIVLISLFLNKAFAQAYYKLTSYNHSSCIYHPTTSYALNNQDTLTQIGEWGWGSCLTVATQGSYAFIGNGTLLQVIDISDPNAPKILREVSTGFLVEKIVISGSYAYVVGAGLSIIDISDPMSPVIKSFIKVGIPALTTITTYKNYVIVGNVTGAVAIVDVSNILNPKILGWATASGIYVRTIITEGNHMFITTSDGETIDDFDISNPASPIRLGDYLFGYLSSGLAVSGNFVYATISESQSSWLIIYDAVNPDSMKLISSVKIPTGIYVPRSITVVDSLAYITLDTAGYAIVNIADRSNPKLIINVPFPYAVKNWEQFSGPLQVSLNTNFAYIACGNGLWSVNIDSVNARTTSFFYTAGSPTKIVMDSSCHVFAAEDECGLKIIDFTDPSKPQLVGEYQPNEAVRDIAVSNNKAYLLCDTDMQILDVSNLMYPVLIGKVVFGDSTTGSLDQTFGSIILSGSTIYAARNSKRLYSIDVSNPTAPHIKTFCTLTGIPAAISFYQNYLCVANTFQGIQIIDISNSDSLKQSAFLKLTYLTAISIEGNKLYTIDSAGFSEYELTDLINPVLKYNLNLSTSNPVEIKCDKNFAYIADFNNLNVVDISNPDSGKIVSINSSSTFHDAYSSCIAVFNNIVALGTISEGILFLRNDLITKVNEESNITTPKKFALLQNYPNPFNPSTTISFQLSEAGYVKLKVYDILGRKIITLVDGRQSVGMHKINFNSNNLPSGIYIYIITANKKSLTRKMMLLK